MNDEPTQSETEQCFIEWLEEIGAMTWGKGDDTGIPIKNSNGEEVARFKMDFSGNVEIVSASKMPPQKIVGKIVADMIYSNLEVTESE